MAKVFVALLGVLVVLNALTFLVVINQEPSAGGGTPATASKDSGVTDQKLQSLDFAVKNLKTTLDGLSRKLDDLPKRMAREMPRAAPQPAIPARTVPAVPQLPAATIPEEGGEDFVDESAPEPPAPTPDPAAPAEGEPPTEPPEPE